MCVCVRVCVCVCVYDCLRRNGSLLQRTLTRQNLLFCRFPEDPILGVYNSNLQKSGFGRSSKAGRQLGLRVQVVRAQGAN